MTTGTRADPEILSDSEAAHRRTLLAELQARLAELGFQSVLAQTHRLVLRYSDGVTGPSGPTNPRLHLLQPGPTCIITTDGTIYALPGSQTCPATDSATQQPPSHASTRLRQRNRHASTTASATASQSPEPRQPRRPGPRQDRRSLLRQAGYGFTIQAWDGDAYLKISNALGALTDLIRHRTSGVGTGV